jgi:hypothetical protein
MLTLVKDGKLFSTAGKFFCRALGTTIESADPVLSKLSRFLVQVESYFHPSNAGSWSGDLAYLLYGFLHTYVKRKSKGSTLDLTGR